MVSSISEFLRRRSRCLVLLLMLISGFAAHVTLQGNGLRATDDNLVFYLAGLKVFHGPELDALNDRAIKYYTDKGADPHAMMRLKLHKVSLNEYAFPGVIYYGVSRILKPLYDPAPGLYPLFVTQSLVFGFYATFILTILVLAGAFAALRSRILLWAMALTLAVYGLSEFLPLEEKSLATILVHPSLGDVFTHTSNLLFRPSAQFSPLSFPTRSQFALLLIALFALRWRGHHASAYALLFLMSFYHLSASGLLMVMLAGIDLLVRPAVFRRPGVQIALGVQVLVFFYRENMWEYLLSRGLTPLFAAGAAVVVLLGLAAVPTIRRALFGPDSFYARAQRWLARRGPVAADLILIVGSWLATAVVLYPVLRTLDYRNFETAMSVFYFWGNVHGRIMTLVMPSVVFGCLVLLLARLARGNVLALGTRGAVVVPLVLVVTTAATVALALQPRSEEPVLPRVASGFFRIEQALAGGPLPQLRATGTSETILYYGFSKSVDGHPRQLDAAMR